VLLAVMFALATAGLIVRRTGSPATDSARLVRFTIAPPENVTFDTPFMMSPFALSADGRHLAFAGRGNDSIALWLHSFDSNVSRLLPGTDRIGFGSAIAASPSGALAYWSGAMTTTQPGEKWSVSAGGGSFPVWRHDSGELFYRAADGKLMAVPIGPGADLSPGTPIPLFEPQRAEISTLGYGRFYDVAPDGRFLINILVERISPPATVVLNRRPE
jgi:hypothetical protein